MPYPRDWQREQMPRGCPGGGWALLELIDALPLIVAVSRRISVEYTQQISSLSAIQFMATIH